MNADYLEIRQAYLAHYKTKGAKKGIRRFQSYEVAPNPSGYVGQEVGEAAKQAQRVGDDDEKQQLTKREQKVVRKIEKAIDKHDRTARNMIDAMYSGGKKAVASMPKNYNDAQKAAFIRSVSSDMSQDIRSVLINRSIKNGELIDSLNKKYNTNIDVNNLKIVSSEQLVASVMVNRDALDNMMKKKK